MTEPADGPLPDQYQALMDSDRVSRRTRQVLAARLPEPSGPSVLAPAHQAALHALLARVVPQDGVPIDLAARVAALLAAGVGDGWRVATQPPDLDAYRAGLDTLDEAARAQGADGFAALDPARQDALLHLVADGEAPAGTLTAAQMEIWFEEVRGDATRLYVAHPRTLARMGFSGIGYGGDGARLQGLDPARREDWEPLATGVPA